jgi:hypothetical protein
MVTSKPKRISVAAGVVHMMLFLNWCQAKLLVCNIPPFIQYKQYRKPLKKGAEAPLVLPSTY